MSQITVKPLTQEAFNDFVNLINALADYEKLPRPDESAIGRLRRDAFSVLPRFWAWIAYSNDIPVGYAIAFETYSSFLAKPTMYLEDLFVLESARGKGAGGLLFDTVRNLASERECGRMDWTVLDWNDLAQDFYTNRGASWLEEWRLFRLDM